MSKKSQKNNRRRSKRTARSNEGGVLLGALMHELPDVFETHVLSKLSVKDHLSLALVNRACRDHICKLQPIAFMRTCIDTMVDPPSIITMQGSVIAKQERLCAEIGDVGRVDVLRWLWNHGFKSVHSELAHLAAIRGHKHVFKWIFELPRKYHHWVGHINPYSDHALRPYVDLSLACWKAVEVDNLSLLQCFKENGCPERVWKEYCLMAPGLGYVHIMQWAYANGLTMEEEELDDEEDGSESGSESEGGDDSEDDYEDDMAIYGEPFTALSDDMDVPDGDDTDLTDAFGFPLRAIQWSYLSCKDAALEGHLEALKWLRAKNCPWNCTVYGAAADGEHYHIIKWACDNGYPFESDRYQGGVSSLWDDALENEDEDLLACLVDNKLPGWKDYAEIYESVRATGQWPME